MDSSGLNMSTLVNSEDFLRTLYQQQPPTSAAVPVEAVAALQQQQQQQCRKNKAPSAKKKKAAADSSSDLWYNFNTGRDDSSPPRSFHELVQLAVACEALNRDERIKLKKSLSGDLRPLEVAICNGNTARRPIRDILQTLYYGLNANANKMRQLTLQRMQRLGVQGLTVAHITDKFMIKNVDMWYEYTLMDACEWYRGGVLAENVQWKQGYNSLLDGRACRNCVHALIRLGRSGIWPKEKTTTKRKDNSCRERLR